VFINYSSLSLDNWLPQLVLGLTIQELYLLSILVIMVYGLYYSIRYIKMVPNLNNNNITFLAKITLLLVPFIFIIIRFGLIPKLGNLSYIIPSTIYCESTNGRGGVSIPNISENSSPTQSNSNFPSINNNQNTTVIIGSNNKLTNVNVNVESDSTRNINSLLGKVTNRSEDIPNNLRTTRGEELLNVNNTIHTKNSKESLFSYLSTIKSKSTSNLLSSSAFHSRASSSRFNLENMSQSSKSPTIRSINSLMDITEAKRDMMFLNPMDSIKSDLQLSEQSVKFINTKSKGSSIRKVKSWFNLVEMSSSSKIVFLSELTSKLNYDNYLTDEVLFKKDMPTISYKLSKNYWQLQHEETNNDIRVNRNNKYITKFRHLIGKDLLESLALLRTALIVFG
jgi:hypothetical protein